MKHKFILWLSLFICAGQVQSETEAFVVEVVHTHEVVGELFLPTKPESSMVVLVLGGSSGRINRRYSERLASAGITALSLAYFGAHGLPRTMDNVPVETVSKAIDYLDSRLSDVVTSFGILGVSRGSELAFLAATVDARIRAVVGIVPSSVAWHGQTSPHAWMVAGNKVPSLSFKRQSDDSIHQRAEVALKSKGAQTTVFQFEKINGPILLISATNDHIWPSTMMAKQIINYLSKHNFQHAINHIKLDDDHFIGTENADGFEPALLQIFRR